MDSVTEKLNIYAHASIKKIRNDLRDDSSGATLVIVRKKNEQDFDFIIYNSVIEDDISQSKYQYGVCCVLFKYLLNEYPSIAKTFVEVASEWASEKGD